MAISHDEYHDQLVANLATGFGAMLQQVQQLASKNTELEQQLARVRGEAQYLARSDGPPFALQSQHRLQQESDQYTKPKHRPSGSESGDEASPMRTEDQENARAIANGVDAWKELTDGTGPLWRRHNANKSHERQTQDALNSYSEQDPLPTGHPVVDQNAGGRTACPFAALSHIGEQVTLKVDPSVIQRPESLPTPPHTQGHFVDAPRGDAKIMPDSRPPSPAGSIYKCPIRMLDERSPEEIAQFFENHKHEIPRSHEICVRRYQSNSQAIRELDAKYGNLANMIKGLGMKHQPLLPSKDDEEDDPAMDTKSMRKVESWAHNVDAVHEGADMLNESHSHLSGLDDRRGHFDRPLKEIRVGESPSRPWGISVPPAIPHLSLGKSASTHTPKGAQTRAGEPNIAGREKEIAAGQRTEGYDEDRRRMIFTGPVFIGYGPEQAAAFMEESGLKA